MTTNTESTAVSSAPMPVLLDKAKVKALESDLGGKREFLKTDESSTAYAKTEELVAKVAKETAVADSEDNFYGVPLVTRDDDIESATQICVATVGVRDKASNTNGIKAIVAFTAPSADDFFAAMEGDGESGAAVRAWVA